MTYSFYPKDNGPTILNVARPDGEIDGWGCIETIDGVYVPTPVIDQSLLPKPYAGKPQDSTTDIFGEPI